jgi:hypothetical protein
MRSSIIKIVILFGLLTGCGLSVAGLAEHEATCSELGFKKKTQAYGECVLELDQRETAGRAQAVKQALQQTQIQAQQKGDGTNEHQMCAKFGFTVGSASYSDCRLKIDIAQREQAQRQAAYDIEQQRYQEEQRRYDAQVAEYERQKEKQKGEAFLYEFYDKRSDGRQHRRNLRRSCDGLLVRELECLNAAKNLVHVALQLLAHLLLLLMQLRVLLKFADLILLQLQQILQQKL